MREGKTKDINQQTMKKRTIERSMFYNARPIIFERAEQIDELDLNIDFKIFYVWYKKFQWLSNENEIIINIENVEPYFIFSNKPNE